MIRISTTVAPGTSAPLSSVTSPTMAAFVVWAQEALGASNWAAAKTPKARKLNALVRINPPSESFPVGVLAHS